MQRKGQVYFYNTVDKPKQLQTSVPVNLDLENIFEADLSFPLSITSWWKTNWNFNGFHHKVRDGSSHAVLFRKSIFTWSFQLNSSFRFGNNWSASLDSRYQSWFLVGDQKQIVRPYVNLGARKEFAAGNTLGIVLQDLTNNAARLLWEYNQPEVGIRTFGNHKLSERQIRVTYTHLFGNLKLSGRRERKTGAEEVKSRM